jgi:hypothetical protein
MLPEQSSQSHSLQASRVQARAKSDKVITRPCAADNASTDRIDLSHSLEEILGVGGLEHVGALGPPPSPSLGPHGAGLTGRCVRSGMQKCRGVDEKRKPGACHCLWEVRTLVSHDSRLNAVWLLLAVAFFSAAVSAATGWRRLSSHRAPGTAVTFDVPAGDGEQLSAIRQLLNSIKAARAMAPADFQNFTDG